MKIKDYLIIVALGSGIASIMFALVENWICASLFVINIIWLGALEDIIRQQTKGEK